MFNAILAEHAAKQAALREENERARRAAASALAGVTEELASAVNDGERPRPAPLPPAPHVAPGVAEVFNTQRVIETSARELQQQAAQFAKQTGRWCALVSDFDRALKEVGDFENWVKVMECAPAAREGSHAPHAAARWDMQAVAQSLEVAAAPRPER